MFKDVAIISITVFLLAFIGKSGYDNVFQQVTPPHTYSEVFKDEIVLDDQAIKEIRDHFLSVNYLSHPVGATTMVNF